MFDAPALTKPAGNVGFSQLVLRGREDLRGFVHFHQVSQVEIGRTVGYPGRLLHIMRDDHNRILPLKLVNQLFFPSPGVLNPSVVLAEI